MGVQHRLAELMVRDIMLTIFLTICLVLGVRGSPQFPSIYSESKSPAATPYQFPQPQLDLVETQLAKNSPMAFSIPRPQFDLQLPFSNNRGAGWNKDSDW